VTRTRADYYTDAIDYTRLKILEEFDSTGSNSATAALGEVHLVRRVAGYKKIRYYTHENVGFGKINLPDQEMHTTAVWWRVAPEALAQAFPSRQQALDGFLGAAYAVHHVAALQTMAEPRDLGRAVGDGGSGWFARVGISGRGVMHNSEGEVLSPDGQQRFAPTLFLYDDYPGGVGLSQPLFDGRRRLIDAAAELISGCDCRFGCPACIGPILASDERRGHSAKAAARKILEMLDVA
jgi:DEAD/DEAH box helicase domain-containing protein